MSGNVAFRIYVRELNQKLATGDATEHTHRPALKAMLEAIEDGLNVINEPKQIKCGAPDLRIMRGEAMGKMPMVRGEIPVGHIETKDIGANLDQTERSVQLKRYREALPNLILSDYLEFRWYVEGQHRETAKLATLDHHGKVHWSKEGVEATERLFEQFFAQEVATIGRPKELAQRMAKLAQLIRGLIEETFKQEEEKGSLHGQLEAFRETLIPDLKEDQFADMYAQTIAYGLFAAWVPFPDSTTGVPSVAGHGQDAHDTRSHAQDAHGTGRRFTRQEAAWNLPKTNPFLRKLFNEIAGVGLDDRVAWVVDDLAHVLDRADKVEVMRDFGTATKQEDPVVHFYETFLAAYDPKMRKSRGVYYTPEPVVSYIVRSVDHLLKTKFDKPLGLADPNVMILDPACGTGTFLYFVIQHIYDTLKEKGQLGGWNDYVKTHLLPRIFGFELLMAPYTIAHMKLGLLLNDLGYDFSGDQRLEIYLTNTLEEAITKAQTLGFAGFITEEANAAADVKREKPIMVVLGNPPYSVSSVNKGEQIEKLMDRYKKAVRGERNIQPLSDDYIKFIRFAHDRIERTGYGIVGMITNNSYLSGLIHRGMREELLKTFDEIYILNLHGNSLIGETTPDGGKDENVFDIRQGVGISILTKKEKPDDQKMVGYDDVWGIREGKYKYLWKNDLNVTSWQDVHPTKSHFFFVPRDVNVKEEYDKGWNVSDVFKIKSSGVKTHRDHFVVGFDEKSLLSSIAILREKSITDSEIGERYKLLDKGSWSLADTRKKIQEDKDWNKYVKSYMYRPFDIRKIYYHIEMITRHRQKVMRNLFLKNIGLCLMRKPIPTEFTQCLVTSDILDINFYAFQTYLFPLYLYDSSEKENEDRIVTVEAGRKQNLTREFIRVMEGKLGMKFESDGKGSVTSGDTGFQPVINHGQDAHDTDAHGTTFRIRKGAYLPHWTQEGAEYFVTFRLHDSLPQTILKQLREEYEQQQQETISKTTTVQDPREKKRQEQYLKKMDKYLDAGYGACWLKDDRIAKVVQDAILYFHNKKYQILAWSIMPNHVHVVLQPHLTFKLSDILHSWKSYSAQECNKILGRTGEFWLSEYYDHLIRDDQDRIRCVEYTYFNSEKAGFENWKWRGGIWEMENHGQDAHDTDTHSTMTFGPEDVLHYMYAIFHSPTYRERYQEFLKIDFPRVPLTSDRELFVRLCGLGEELVGLHLMESPRLQELVTTFDAKGSGMVEEVRYVEVHGQDAHATMGRVYINKDQYFEGIDREVWEFHVGGYQVLHKWLKDRKGRTLSWDDQQHYQKIVVALKETMRLMGEIDGVIPKWPIE